MVSKGDADSQGNSASLVFRDYLQGLVCLPKPPSSSYSFYTLVLAFVLHFTSLTFASLSQYCLFYGLLTPSSWLFPARERLRLSLS